MADRLRPDRAAYLSWWPSLNNDVQTEHELIHMNDNLKTDNTVSPFCTVLRHLVNSQLRCLVIITINSIYGKKNSQIRYPFVFCLHSTVAPPSHAASFFPRFLALNTSEILTVCFLWMLLSRDTVTHPFLPT